MTYREKLRRLRGLRNSTVSRLHEKDQQIYSLVCEYPDPYIIERIRKLQVKRQTLVEFYAKICERILEIHCKENLDQEVIE